MHADNVGPQPGARGHRFAWAQAVAVGLVLLLVAPMTSAAQGTVRNDARGSADTLRLTRDEARALATRGNPDLRAVRVDVDIARGELRQAGVLVQSNPEVDLLTRGLGPEVGIVQTIEVAGQRGVRRRAARAAVDRSLASTADVTRTMLGDVDRAFYRTVAAGRRNALAAEILELNRRLSEVARQQLAAGAISTFDYTLAAVELGRSRARVLSAQREYIEAMSELHRLLGLEPQASIVAVMDSVPRPLLDADSLLDLALARRPDLTERMAALRMANAAATLARREALPDLLLRVSSERVEGTDTRELRPGLGLAVPLFNWNRGTVQARQAAVHQAELAREGLRTRVRNEVARAVVSYRAAAAAAELLHATVLEPARENRARLEAAYREGKVGMPVLLLIRSQVTDAELEYWDAWLAEHLALADLAEATGETVVGLTLPDAR